MTKPGRLWIHGDADFYRDPLTLKIKERFGWSGVIFFDAFLRGCKRSHPQGQVSYTSEEELVHFLGVADLMRVSCANHEWSITDFWRFMARRRPPMVRSWARDGRVMVTSCAWHEWEVSASSANHAERMRRSRAQKRDTNVARKNAEIEKEKEKEKERESVRGRGADSSSASPQGAETSSAKNGTGAEPAMNGSGRPDPAALVAMVAAIEAQQETQ